MKEKTKYSTIMINGELKAELDKLCRNLGLRTYTELLRYFIEINNKQDENR